MRRAAALLLFAGLLFGSLSFAPGVQTAFAQTAAHLQVSAKPAPAPPDWAKNYVGEYEAHGLLAIVAEDAGHLTLRVDDQKAALEPMGPDAFRIVGKTPFTSSIAHFGRSVDDGQYRLYIAQDALLRKDYRPGGAQSFHIQPAKPASQLRQEALAAKPPVESGQHSKPDLVELVKLDPSIHLDIRYATANNFLSTPFYAEARAFMQRPAAEALVRVNRKLRDYGYGLVVHDAYRPWFVTRMFWDATPSDKKKFVADPEKGSFHNRGTAVDLSLYDLASGKPVDMPSGYDEMSDRAYPDYPGGTSLERWNRDLLRKVMESENFEVYKFEWWHFDYQVSPEYPIMNVSFDQIPSAKQQAAQ